MAALLAKISEIREKASGAMEDVPDTLIGTIVSLLILTLLGLGLLMFLGFLVTQ
jgi:Na+-translocating ferredoxin:NAD+ oxidoreductase RnfA subunit